MGDEVQNVGATDFGKYSGMYIDISYQMLWYNYVTNCTIVVLCSETVIDTCHSFIQSTDMRRGAELVISYSMYDYLHKYQEYVQPFMRVKPPFTDIKLLN